MKKLLFLLIFPLTLFSQDLKIGNQTWMKSNLDVIIYKNGDSIPFVENKSKWLNLKEGAYCIYEGEKLYNWYALSDPRGLAPKGYHLPTHSEWLELLFFLKVPMGKVHLETRNGLLKSSGFYSYNTGIRDMIMGFSGYGEKGFSNWWCIDDVDNSKAYHCVVYDLRAAELTSTGGYKGHGMSVRCIKNK